MRSCRNCAKKGDRIEMKVERETFTLRVFKCPKCGKIEVINRK